MKKLSLTLAVVLSAITSFAAVENFNQMINETEKSQKAVHQAIRASTISDEAEVVAPTARHSKPEVIVGTIETVHVNTDKQLLKFAKEKKVFKASDMKNNNRIAEEFSDLE